MVILTHSMKIKNWNACRYLTVGPYLTWITMSMGSMILSMRRIQLNMEINKILLVKLMENGY